MNTRCTSCSRFVFVIESADVSKTFCPSCGKPVERMFFTHLSDNHHLRNIERNRNNDLFVYVRPTDGDGEYKPYAAINASKPDLGHHYLSGAVTGLDPEAVWLKFETKEKALVAQGLKVFNPVKFIYSLIRSGHVAIDDYDRIMCHCLHEMALLHIQEGLTVHHLHDWQVSKGAAIENNFAKIIAAHIVYP